MKEHNGVILGDRVKDLSGNALGRVTALYSSGFSVVKGLPLLFREDRVIRYDEVRGRSDGFLVVSRTPDDLFTLAEGGLPDSWKVETRSGTSMNATPSEGARILGRGFGRK